MKIQKSPKLRGALQHVRTAECHTIKASMNKSYQVDIIPNTVKYASKTSLIDRLKAEKCELCGKTNCAIEIHHIRKLKDLSGKSYWEKFMIARNRKTLALCEECHDKLHNGKLN